LLINGEPADQYDFSLATCCNPLPGDQVFAYLTSNAGLKVHRINCPNSGHLMANYGYRVMKAEWVYTGVGNFVADLKITGMDKGPGVIEQLTHAISSHLGINIRSLNIAGKDGYYEATISLNVASTNQLNQVIHSLKNMDIVSTVARIE
jgi:GTP pyrophosphokinase